MTVFKLLTCFLFVKYVINLGAAFAKFFLDTAKMWYGIREIRRQREERDCPFMLGRTSY